MKILELRVVNNPFGDMSDYLCQMLITDSPEPLAYSFAVKRPFVEVEKWIEDAAAQVAVGITGDFDKEIAGEFVSKCGEEIITAINSFLENEHDSKPVRETTKKNCKLCADCLCRSVDKEVGEG